LRFPDGPYSPVAIGADGRLTAAIVTYSYKPLRAYWQAAARADRKPKKDARFQEIDESKAVEAPAQRRLPPARGHGNNTPRALAQEAVAPVAGEPDGSSERGGRGGGGGGGEKLSHRSWGEVRQCSGGRGGGEGQACAAPIAEGASARTSAHGAGARPADIAIITARLAKVQLSKTPTRDPGAGACGKVGEGGGGGGGGGGAPTDMAERLALLRQAKAPVSRLRSMGGIKS
jgi:hypothetical protein